MCSLLQENENENSILPEVLRYFYNIIFWKIFAFLNNKSYKIASFNLMSEIVAFIRLELKYQCFD